MNHLRNTGAKGTGLTLSEGQYNACKSKAFDVHIKDVRTVKPEDFGAFDAVVSVGAFEHFCSIEEYKAGKQEQIYRDFFETVHNLLPDGGRFYLQSMTFSKKWRKMFRQFNLKKYGLYLAFLVKCLFRKEYRHLIDVFHINPIRVCFERDIMEHYRMVLEQK